MIPGAPPAAPSGAAQSVAVLGAGDSGAAELAAHLGARTRARVATALGGAPTGIDGEPEPNLVLVAVDAVCPVRPDDLEVVSRLAERHPVAVVVTRSAHVADAAENVAATAARLSGRGLAAPLVAGDLDAPVPDDRARDVHAPGEHTPGEHAPHGALVGESLLVEAGRRARRVAAAARVAGGPAGAGSRTAALPRGSTEVLEWLRRNRTESIAGRTQSVRQQSHAARLAVQSTVSRKVRSLAAEARAEIAAARRGDLEVLVARIDSAADEMSRQVLTHARAESAHLRRRHLGPAEPESSSAAPPSLGLRFGRPPVHRGEELALMFMGAAGGIGLGRLVAALFPDSTWVFVGTLAVSLVAGSALGVLSVRTRRTAGLRAHITGLTAEAFAALRTEIDHAVAELLLSAEGAITDAFAHDPGPRVRDIERRIHSLHGSTAHDAKAAP